eukprot:CAMPEP_0194577348 /NCGR_PEP_ID=MMETSP0292-20121207/12163_1 /TAXON_ID=39354 /ORGANISM="Heterosigma akashiwo, Strain CCMP2393" /LENGTH=90 /DNA_ID=CAMNT_0039429707 /DNA_START=203 /DNA_END=472 /DNA_ORIENTATION=-
MQDFEVAKNSEQEDCLLRSTALDLLAEERIISTEESSFKVHAAITQLEDFGLYAGDLHARAYTAHNPHFCGGGACAAHGVVNFDLARGAW